LQAAQIVENEPVKIFKNRTIVVHGGKHDLSALFLENKTFVHSTIVDTQSHYSDLYGRHGQIGLANCAANAFGRDIQHDVYSPIEDADTTMQLYFLRCPYGRVSAQAAKDATRMPTLTASGIKM
jgi:RNA exonuclease 4